MEYQNLECSGTLFLAELGTSLSAAVIVGLSAIALLNQHCFLTFSTGAKSVSSVQFIVGFVRYSIVNTLMLMFAIH